MYRIRLRVGIVGIFLLVMLPLIGTMTGILYLENARLAEETAQSAMRKASESVTQSLYSIIAPISGTVDLSATFGKAQRERLRRPEAWRPVFEALEQQPTLYSLYYGFAQDGEFLQMVRLPPGIEKFGARGLKPPAGAKYVVRTIDSAAGQKADSYIYMAEWGEILRVERNLDVKYDPRQRPWFLAADKIEGQANSGVYVFSGTGRPGLTLSRRIANDDNATMGVFGADISIESLSRILDEQKVGDSGLVFIVDEKGRLIGYPDPELNIKRENNGFSLVAAVDVADPVVSEATKALPYAVGDLKERQQYKIKVNGNTYMVSFTPFPNQFKSNWAIGVVVDEDDFIAPIRKVSLIILFVGTVIIVLACAGVVVASHLLTEPINEIISETKLIRELALDEAVHVETRVSELMQLSDALDSMKSALRSFGVYVPKELVRQIVASGNDTVLGGARQPTTIMFTDLAGFTSASESLSPEDVLARLSDYFDVMALAIDQHQGTIDKYIGDAIMALWNAPVPDSKHQENACRAMLACSVAGKKLNEDFAARGLPPFTTRFGLHTGIVVVGNVGSRSRMQYTALGPAVNLASRVEGINKKFGTELLVTGEVEQVVRNKFLFRPFGPVIASGTSIPIPLFELMAEANCQDETVLERHKSWMTAYNLYLQRQWNDALQAFADFQTQWPKDKASKIFIEHCQEYLTTPPGDEWDAAIRFDSK